MPSTLLVIGNQQDQIDLLHKTLPKACSLQHVHSVEEIPPRSELDPDLFIFTSDIPSQEIIQFASRHMPHRRHMLFVEDQQWETLESCKPADAISTKASAHEIQFRIQHALRQRGQQIIARLGFQNPQQASAWWDMLPAPDWVTGLHNCVSFLQELEKTMSRARRYKRSLCCLLARIDNYDFVRKHGGEDLMDEVLEELAGLLEVSIRDADVLARVEADLFGFILPETEEENAHHVVERIVLNLRQFDFLHPLPEPLRFSFGFAAFDPEHASPEMLLAAAQESLESSSDQDAMPAKEDG